MYILYRENCAYIHAYTCTSLCRHIFDIYCVHKSNGGNLFGKGEYGVLKQLVDQTFNQLHI